MAGNNDKVVEMFNRKQTPAYLDENLNQSVSIQSSHYDIIKEEDNPREDEGGKEMDSNKFDVFMKDIKDDARERDKRYREDLKEQRELFQKQLDEYKQDGKEREERMEKQFNRIDDKLGSMDKHVQNMVDNNQKHNLATLFSVAAIVVAAAVAIIFT